MYLIESVLHIGRDNMGIRTGVGNEIRFGSSRVARHVLLAGFAMGCIANSERTAQPASRSIIADVILSVDNRTRSPVVIYVGANKMSDSLGVVPAHGAGGCRVR